MNLQEIKYDAFISYRHCELDQFVATTLHKELEAFRLPKAIEKQLRAKGITKKKIERVFRDRDELPITNNLADPITNALQNSDFLLVICSPRLRESLWCRKEIETFIKMHGREHIFAVLIEGEPADSFPEELLYEEKVTVDASGNEHVEKVPIEPLAADVRGKNKKEIRKKIKEEVLRLAAPMFDCSYDDLKQRHRERAIRRIIATAGSISAVFAVFGIVSSVMAYRINEQSIQIKEQSVQIQEQSDRINEQYKEALRTNAKQLAEDAFDLMERGDIDAAKETAYQALSGDMPYTAEAEYALSSALQVYRSGLQIAPKRLLKLDSQVDFCKTSPDMTKLMVVDIFDNIKVYDPVIGEELYSVNSDSTYLSEDTAGFINDNTIIYSTDQGYSFYNLDTKKEKKVEDRYASLFKADKKGKYLLIHRYDELEIVDINSLIPVFQLSEENIQYNYEAMFSKENKDIVVVTCTKDDKAGINILDLESEEVRYFFTDSENITSLWVEDENIYLTAYSGSEEIDGTVYCIGTDGSLVWKYELEGLPDEMLVFGKENDKLAFTTYGKLTVLNKEDGTFVCDTECGRDIVNYASYTDSNNLSYMARDGEFHYYMTDDNTDMVFIGKFITNSDNIQDFIYGKGFFASSTYLDNTVAIYENIKGQDVTELVDINDSPYGCRFSPDKKYLVCNVMDSESQMIVVVDLEKKEVVHEIATGSIVTDFAVTDENEIMVLHWDSVQGYDLLSGELLFERETDTSNEYFIRNGNAYVGDEMLDFYMCDTKTGDVLFTMEGNHLLQDGMLTSDIEENGEYYAYASEEEKQLVIGSFEKGDILSLDVNINAIESVNLAMQESVIYLSYLDNTIEVYDIETGEYLRGYDNLTDIVDRVEELVDNKGTLMITSGGAYLLNVQKEMIAYIQGYESYRESTNSFVISNNSMLYEVPYYNTAELLKMAE